MNMQRLAGSEDVLHVHDVSQSFGSSSSKEIENSVRGSLLKMEVRDYNPILPERGFHQKLNLFVKESLQFGLIPPSWKDETSEPNSMERDSSTEAVPPKPTIDVEIIEKETPQIDLTAQEDKTTASIAEEWEQLIVNEIPKIYSPTCISKLKLDRPVLSH